MYSTATTKNLARAHHILSRAGVKGILWGDGSLNGGSKKPIEIIACNRKNVTLPYKTWEKVSFGYTADFEFLPFHIERLRIPAGLYVCPQLCHVYYGSFRERLLQTFNEIKLLSSYVRILPSIRKRKGRFEPLEHEGIKNLALKMDVTGLWFEDEEDYQRYTNRPRHLTHIFGHCKIGGEKREISEWRVGPIYPDLLNNLPKWPKQIEG